VTIMERVLDGGKEQVGRRNLEAVEVELPVKAVDTPDKVADDGNIRTTVRAAVCVIISGGLELEILERDVLASEKL